MTITGRYIDLQKFTVEGELDRSGSGFGPYATEEERDEAMVALEAFLVRYAPGWKAFSMNTVRFSKTRVGNLCPWMGALGEVVRVGEVEE